MPSDRLGSVLHYLQRITREEIETRADGMLLEQFARQRDEAAFTELIQRHGPLVLSVCHRVLGNAHDAEDVFQATFFILARKAASIRQPEALAGWLHRVAYHLAVRLGASNKRRKRQEHAALRPAHTEDRPDADELRQIIDRELDALPEKYRLAIVLCDLQEKTHRQAARQLGWPVGSMSRRLERGRRLLRQRLIRHAGIVSAGAIVASASGRCLALAPDLVAGTAKAAVLFAVGQTATLVGPSVISLAEGAMRAMFWTQLKVIAILALGCLLVGSAGVLAYRLESPHPEAPPRQAPEALADVTQPRNPGATPVVERTTAPFGPTPLQRLAVTQADLLEATGLNIYKFQVGLNKGQHFRVVLQEWAAATQPPRILHELDMEQWQDGPLVLRVSFLRQDGILQEVLLGNQERITMRVESPQCRPAGYVTVVKNPLYGIVEGKQLVVADSKQSWGSLRGEGVRLVGIFKNQVPNNSLNDLYPRAELILLPPQK